MQLCEGAIYVEGLVADEVVHEHDAIIRVHRFVAVCVPRYLVARAGVKALVFTDGRQRHRPQARSQGGRGRGDRWPYCDYVFVFFGVRVIVGRAVYS